MAKKQLHAKKSSRGRHNRFDKIVAAGIAVALIAIMLILWGPFSKVKQGEEKRTAPQAKKQAASEPREKQPAEKKEKAERHDKKTAPETAKRGQPPVVKPDKAPLVAIVIDDLGQDVKPALELASLPYRITFAVMPGLPQSRKVAELALQNDGEVLLHLPMEYRNKNGKPAPGMLRSDMTPMDFLKTLSENVASVPGATGVNNHEGSLLTENKEAMKFLMAELKARDLIFLDSLTSPKSVAYATAKEFGLKAAKRDVFLDNESDNPESIRKQLEELAHIAKERGWAVGIGHPHVATINELRKWLATASQQGIRIVPVSRLVN